MGSQGVGWGKTGVDAGSPGTKTQASSGPWQFLTSLSSAEESFPYFTATPEFMPALFRAVFLPRPRSVRAGLRLDSLGLLPAGTFQSRQPFSPRTAARPERMQKLGTESPAGISPASHGFRRLGSGLFSQQLQSPSRRRDPPARPQRSPGRCHPPSCLAPPTIPRRSPLPLWRAVRAGAQQSSGTLREKPGEAWAAVRGRAVPPVPGRKELERARAEQHFTVKFPPLNRLEL